ncbi:hypothetical protein SEF58_10410 [Neomoorella humiferrea]|uniref:hypothetical protein n=1 Tax=Neomoorella humiferrea TaxID=676965 RepID=UPI003D911BCD
MTKVFWGDGSLPPWEIDAQAKPLLPLLCRSMGINFLEDGEGNFILAPPLADQTIVLRSLESQVQELDMLLANISRELRRRGANVLIVPAAAGDERLLPLWQTQVLFSFTRRETGSPEPALRFFYPSKRRQESLRLIAALVQAMLRSGKALKYSIPGSWEIFKNFRYRRFLNTTVVPAILIEFIQINLDHGVTADITTWLVSGLTQYFQKPLTEETIFKLQTLLQRLREFLPPALPKESSFGESKVLPAGTQAVTMEPQGRIATVSPESKAAVEEEKGEAAVLSGMAGTEVSTPPGSAEETVLAPSGAEAGGSTPEKRVTVQQKETPEVVTPEGARRQAGEVKDITTAAADRGKPPAGTLVSGSNTLRQQLPLERSTGAGRVKNRHRGNPFAPPGDGPVFIFKRPLEAGPLPAVFPQEVLERMAPLPLQSLLLPSPSAGTAPAGLLNGDGLNHRTIKPTSGMAVHGSGNNDTLEALKKLSAAILAAERPEEPLNGEAPSI